MNAPAFFVVSLEVKLILSSFWSVGATHSIKTLWAMTVAVQQGKASHFLAEQTEDLDEFQTRNMPVAGDCLMLLNSKVRYVESSKK